MIFANCCKIAVEAKTRYLEKAAVPDMAALCLIF